jgi:hypothetical protein
MGCFFAQNLTVFEKPKPKDQCERDAEKPSVFAARLRTGVHKGALMMGPLKSMVCTWNPLIHFCVKSSHKQVSKTSREYVSESIEFLSYLNREAKRTETRPSFKINLISSTGTMPPAPHVIFFGGCQWVNIEPAVKSRTDPVIPDVLGSRRNLIPLATSSGVVNRPRKLSVAIDSRFS